MLFVYGILFCFQFQLFPIGSGGRWSGHKRLCWCCPIQSRQHARCEAYCPCTHRIRFSQLVYLNVFLLLEFASLSVFNPVFQARNGWHFRLRVVKSYGHFDLLVIGTKFKLTQIFQVPWSIRHRTVSAASRCWLMEVELLYAMCSLKRTLPRPWKKITVCILLKRA